MARYFKLQFIIVGNFLIFGEFIAKFESFPTSIEPVRESTHFVRVEIDNTKHAGGEGSQDEKN